MIIKEVHHDGHVNYIHIPEDDEEREAMYELALRIEKDKRIKAISEIIERIITNGDN